VYWLLIKKKILTQLRQVVGVQIITYLVKFINQFKSKRKLFSIPLMAYNVLKVTEHTYLKLELTLKNEVKNLNKCVQLKGNTSHRNVIYIVSTTKA